MVRDVLHLSALAVAGMFLFLGFRLTTPVSVPTVPVAPKIEPRVVGEIPAPAGFRRTEEERASFGSWLRALPLKPSGSRVLLFDGREKSNQSAHAAVVDLDVGAKDLQQCADAVIRLRAEYLFARGRTDEIAFRYTNGERAEFGRGSYADLRRYLERVFMYAGTRSLARDMTPVRDLRIGDVFVQGGSPGHAVIVVDVAVSGDRTIFLLAQSYMPAQDIHVLRNGDSPWFEVDPGRDLVTPEWTFRWSDLRRF